MRVRASTPTAATALRDALARVGADALPIGDTLELVHPDAAVTNRGNVELRFFVRALELAQLDDDTFAFVGASGSR